jgi:hypothetical protein
MVEEIKYQLRKIIDTDKLIEFQCTEESYPTKREDHILYVTL